MEQLLSVIEKLPRLAELSIDAAEQPAVVMRSADAVSLWIFTTTEWAAIGQMIGGLSSLGLLIFAWWQIRSAFTQARIWRTLEVCEKYDTDPVIDAACRNLTGLSDEHLKSLARSKSLGTHFTDIASVLNYLDGVAVGIEQKLYDENIVYDHISYIIFAHSKRFLNETDRNLFVNRDHYKTLIWLTKKFENRTLQKPQTTFTSKT